MEPERHSQPGEGVGGQEGRVDLRRNPYSSDTRQDPSKCIGISQEDRARK